MGTIKKFEDLEIWQLAKKFNKRIFLFLKFLRNKKEFELRSQLDGSAGWIMDNIAEGFERKGNREFVQHLSIAKGSAGESKSQLYRSFDRDLLSESDFKNYGNDLDEIRNKIGGMMNYLNKSEIKEIKFKK